MKRSELRQVIREEIDSIIESNKTIVSESLFDKIVDSIFGSLKTDQEKKAYAAMAKDPEYVKAKAKLDKATKDAHDFLVKMREKYNKDKF